MSVYLTHGSGRIYVQPSRSGCDVSLSGQVIEREMYLFMRELFWRECDGFKQRNRNRGWDKQPFWSTSDFVKVKEAIRWYAGHYSVCHHTVSTPVFCFDVSSVARTKD
jgi:hypothetical protein